MWLGKGYPKELPRRKLNSEKLEDGKKADPSEGFFYRLVMRQEIKNGKGPVKHKLMIDLLSGATGAFKYFISRAPAIGEALAGIDAYNKSKFERGLKEIIDLLVEKDDDIEDLFSNEWLLTDDGKVFIHKAFDSALDSQIAEKRELFVNALINGVQNKQITNLENLKIINFEKPFSGFLNGPC